MISVYSNNHFTDKIIQSLNLHDQYQITHSVEQHFAIAADFKLAFINCLNSFNVFDSEQKRIQWVIDGNGFSAEISQLKTQSNLVFAFDNEVHPYHVQLFQQHCDANVYWAVPAYVNDPGINSSNVILFNFVFDQCKKFYNQILYTLQDLKHCEQKPLYFDALLGMPRAHRDFLYEKIKAEDLQQKIKLTYLKPDLNDESVLFEWAQDVDQAQVSTDNGKVTVTWPEVAYHGQVQPMARIIPVDLYNRTAYSIIAETGYQNFYSFFTEKTAKAILAKRLFVMFSGHRFLENFRKMGFKTFDSVIDESYDHIADNHERWCAAFEQVKRLCTMDQVTVMTKVLPIVEHNYSVLMNTDWDQHLLSGVQKTVDQYLLNK